MSADDFLDTNILLYSVSSDPVKAARADALIADGGVISVQVLNEFSNVASKKYAVSIKKIREILSSIRLFCVVRPLDIATHDLGLDIAERYKFSIYDSMLLASALKAGCTTFFNEDMHHGQKVDGLTIRNPFKP